MGYGKRGGYGGGVGSGNLIRRLANLTAIVDIPITTPKNNFTISEALTELKSLMVFKNGDLLPKNAYTISGTTVTVTNGLIAGDLIQYSIINGDMTGIVEIDDLASVTSQDKTYSAKKLNDTFAKKSHNHNNLATKEEVSVIDTKVTNINNDLTTHKNNSEIHHTHSNKSTLDTITPNKISEWDGKSNFDGSYNSLTNKPVIPTVDVNKSYVDSEIAKRDSIINELKTNLLAAIKRIEALENGTNPPPPTETYGNIVLSRSVIDITEGAATTFTVKLDKAPTNNQTITITKDNEDVTLNKTELIFTPENWNTSQTINLNVREDSDTLDETCIITLSSPKIENKTITVNITDNDKTPTVKKAICGQFKCGELKCGEGLEQNNINEGLTEIKSVLSDEFKKRFNLK